MRQSTRLFIVDRRRQTRLFPLAEFVVHDVDDDAIQERRELCLTSKMRQRPEQPEEHLLRHVLQAEAISGKARDRPEDHLLMAFDELLEVLQTYETAIGANC